MTTMLAQVLVETPAPPSSIDLQLNAGFDAVLSMALSKTAARRFGASRSSLTRSRRRIAAITSRSR